MIGYAASFDCGHAAQPREKVICNDAGLSALDGQLGKLYQERLGRLSVAGQALLTTSQKSWLHFARAICPLPPFDTPRDPLPTDPVERRFVLERRDPVQCITRTYKDRLEQLLKAGQHRGPYMFNRKDLFFAAPSHDNTGEALGFIADHVSYPQIDSPLTPAATVFNQKMVRPLPTTGDCESGGDYDFDYELGLVAHGLISLSLSDSTYCHGTHHAYGGSLGKTYLLGQSLRRIVASDIFGKTKGWQEKLETLLWQNLKESGWAYWDDNHKYIVHEVVPDNDRWFLTEMVYKCCSEHTTAAATRARRRR